MGISRGPYVGDVLAALEIATNRRRSYQLMGHLLFCGTFIVSTMMARRIHSVWSVEESIRQELSGGTTGFQNIRSLKDIHSWLELTLVPAVFWKAGSDVQRWHAPECIMAAQAKNMTEDVAPNIPDMKSLSDKLYSVECQKAYVRWHNRIVSPVRFRQAVVRQDSCHFEGEELPIHSPCYPSYGLEKAQVKGLCAQDAMTFPCEYKEDLPMLLGIDGTNYGTAGFVLTVPRDKDRKGAAVEAFRENFGDGDELLSWLSPGTRVITAEFITYNANVDVLTLARFQFDVTAGGRIQPSTQLWSVRLWPYRTMEDTIRFGFECAYAIGALVFLASLLYTYGRGQDGFRAWVFVELLSAALHICTIVAWALFVRSSVRADFHGAVSVGDPDTVQYFPDDLDELLRLYGLASWAAAANATIMALMTVRHFRVLSCFAVLWEALEHSAAVLISSGIVLGMLLIGFAICGHLMFGGRMEEFHTVSLTLRTLFLGIGGRFNYVGMRRAAPVFAPIYMTAWLLTVGFCLSSVFVAVLAQGLSTVRDIAARQETVVAATGCRVAFAPPLDRFLDAILSRIPRCVFGRDAAPVVDAARKRCLIRSKLRKDKAAQLALKRVNKVSRKLCSSQRFTNKVRELADAGFEQLSIEELTEKLGSREAADKYSDDLNKVRQQLDIIERELKPTPGATTAPSAVDAAASRSEATGGFWSQALDEEMREALNMLRFEVNTFSHAVRRLEHIKAPPPGTASFLGASTGAAQTVR